MYYFRILTLLIGLRSCTYANDMAHMTLTEAATRLEQVCRASGPTRDFIKEAITAQRLDILEHCWEKAPGGIVTEHFLDELKILPGSKVENGERQG